MGNRLCMPLAILAGLSLTVLAARAGDDSSIWDRSRIKTPPLREVRLPDVDRVALKNGMVLYILEDHEFPVVQGRVLVRSGSILDPKEKTGLADMTGTVLRTGGSAKYPGDDLDRRLESIGATVEFSLGQLSGEGTFWTLKEYAPEILDVVASLLRGPAFPEEKLALAKSEMRRSIAARNDDPMDILMRESGRLVWGKDHPLAAVPEYATVDAVTRQDLVDFHRQTFSPDRISMVLWGDFDQDQVRAQVEGLFSDWPPSGSPASAQLQIPPIVPGGSLAYAEKEGMTNAWIIEGHIGIKADNPDYAAMNVLGEILGGGFSSRLFNEIRTRRGLAYAAGSSSGTDIARPGIFLAYAGTRADSALVVLELMRQEVKRTTEEPVTEVELNRAKDAILNSYVFKYESKGQIAARMAYLDFLGYPADFTARYPEMVRNLTAQDLLAAAKRQIHPDDLQMLVVGNEKDFAMPLASLGRPFEKIDLTIPGPGGEAEFPTPTPESLAEGKRLVVAAAQATGGAGWASLRDLTQDLAMQITIQGQQLPITLRSVRTSDGKLCLSQKLPFGEITMARTASGGWSKSPQGIKDLGAEDLAEMSKEVARDFWSLFGAAEAGQSQALDPEQVDGKSCNVVRYLEGEAEGLLLYLDPATNLPVAMRFRDRSMMGDPVMATEFFGDYRGVGPVQLPHAIRILQDGQPFATGTMTSAAANGGVDPKIFEKPAQ